MNVLTIFHYQSLPPNHHTNHAITCALLSPFLALPFTVPPGASNADIRDKATDLQKDLKEVEHRWYQLGVLLGLPVHILDGFQENYDDLSHRLRAMLQEWLKKGNTGEYEIPSWQVLVNAVEHSAGGGNPRLAGELAKGSYNTLAYLSLNSQLPAQVLVHNLLYYVLSVISLCIVLNEFRVQSNFVVGHT